MIARGRAAWRRRGAHRGRALTRRVDHGNPWRFGDFFDEPSTGRNHGADQQEAAQPGARRTDALIVVLSVLELQNVTALLALVVIVVAVDLIVVISGRRFCSRRNGALLGGRRREGCSGGCRSGMPLTIAARIARMRAEAEKIRAAQQAAARPAAAIGNVEVVGRSLAPATARR